MEVQELFSKEIGNKEQAALKAEMVKVVGIRIDSKTKKEDMTKKVGELVVLICKHPNREEPIEISKIKYLKGDQLRVTGLWINLDIDGNLQLGSPLSQLLQIAKIQKFAQLQGKELMTIIESEAKPYLCIKGY